MNALELLSLMSGGALIGCLINAWTDVRRAYRLHRDQQRRSAYEREPDLCHLCCEGLDYFGYDRMGWPRWRNDENSDGPPVHRRCYYAEMQRRESIVSSNANLYAMWHRFVSHTKTRYADPDPWRVHIMLPPLLLVGLERSHARFQG